MLLKNSTFLIFSIILVSLLMTWFVDSFYLDAIVARMIYDRESAFGIWVRDYSQYPPIVFSVMLLVIIIKINQVPLSKENRKILRESSLAWLITLFLGVLFTINVTLKLGAERPRPKSTHILVDGGRSFQAVLEDGPEGTEGKSFPSGHSSMGFLLASPFFLLLLRKRYLLSASVLVAGVSFGGFIGYGRMILGAHFFTDVYWAGIVVLVSSIVAGLIVLYKSEDKFLVLSEDSHKKLYLRLEKLKRVLTFR
ncbi:MAG TPA: hypothetical protein DCL21_00145 [Alphaproteobacteria bacterium]|nr:hypothetical protein [Alphaproteobacteria bacterium]